MNKRELILKLLTLYKPTDPSEIKSLEQITSFVKESEDCFENSFIPGHITGSALVINSKFSKVLLGGHSDGHNLVKETAFREASEESGLNSLEFLPEITGIFDVDVHPIPATEKMPSHDHYDIRFLLVADENEPYSISHESKSLKWVAFEDVSTYNSQPAFLRMITKVKSLKNSHNRNSK